jgi:hypothetical protein
MGEAATEHEGHELASSGNRAAQNVFCRTGANETSLKSCAVDVIVSHDRNTWDTLINWRHSGHRGKHKRR